MEKQTFNSRHSTPNVQVSYADTTTGFMICEDSEGRKFDLENRLLEFSAAVIDLSEQLPTSRAGNHVAGQILRCGTSPYPNHGEAEAAESRDDFIHKMKICLKELRETRRWARLIEKKKWINGNGTLQFVLKEVEELICIFFSSIQTARRNALSSRSTNTRYRTPPSDSQ